MLAIGRAMYFGARVLILDEPTSALGVKEAATVLRFVQSARAEGVGIVFITHNAHHATLVGDLFTVLIQGRMAASFRRGEKEQHRTAVPDGGRRADGRYCRRAYGAGLRHQASVVAKGARA